MNVTPLLLFVHIAGVVVWVGGMFFAYVCLRPVAGQQLDPPQRLCLWAGVFARFFRVVWLAVIAILLSGSSMLLAVGFRAAPVHWHLMMAAGLAMVAIFGYVFFAPFRRLQASVAASDWKSAAADLNRIRHAVAVNLTLGGLTVAIATLGRYL